MKPAEIDVGDSRTFPTDEPQFDIAAQCREWLSDPYLEVGYFEGGAEDIGLANLERLTPEQAPRRWTNNILGEPCASDSGLWPAVVDLPPDWRGPPQLVLPAAAGVRFKLPDARYVLLNPVLNGDYSSASFTATFFSEAGQPLSTPVLMPTGQNRGYHGRLYVPRQQPLGAFHVWLEAGGTWQGHTITRVGVTDFSGSTPRDVADFPSSYSCAGSTACGSESELVSVEYPTSGPDEVTLTWSSWEIEGWGESARRGDVQSRSATYVLDGGRYRLLRGEPPRD